MSGSGFDLNPFILGVITPSPEGLNLPIHGGLRDCLGLVLAN
jgi:hypothetical protein